jgi:hypothetical protein
LRGSDADDCVELIDTRRCVAVDVRQSYHGEARDCHGDRRDGDYGEAKAAHDRFLVRATMVAL